jgi:hypothetical protein
MLKIPEKCFYDFPDWRKITGYFLFFLSRSTPQLQCPHPPKISEMFDQAGTHNITNNYKLRRGVLLLETQDSFKLAFWDNLTKPRTTLN